MPAPASITSTIVESLYDEALLVAEEAHLIFDKMSLLQSDETYTENVSPARMVLSCEALRTTTLLMHSLAWLLNHRSYLTGEMSEFQLRRHGRLPPAQTDITAEELLLLPAHVQDIVRRARALHARITRLDRAWRDHFAMEPSAVHRLRERLGMRLAMRR